jgi:hypothetical protein
MYALAAGVLEGALAAPGKVPLSLVVWEVALHGRVEADRKRTKRRYADTGEARRLAGNCRVVSSAKRLGGRTSSAREWANHTLLAADVLETDQH